MESAGVLTQLALKVALGVVLALGATGAVRYVYGLRSGCRAVSRCVRVTETAVLGQNRALHLVIIGRRTFLIGSTSGQIVMLADVTDDEGSATPAEQSRTAEFPTFARAMASVLARFRGLPGMASQIPGDPADRLRAAASALRAHSARET